MNRAKIFKQAFDGRAPQQIVSDATKERGYREGFTPEQFLARQVLKMQEELAELVNFILGFEDDDLAEDIFELGEHCRASFDNVEGWENSDAVLTTPAKEAPEKITRELADMQVVLFNMAQIVSEITGEPFDVISAAVEKSRSDVERGVR